MAGSTCQLRMRLPSPGRSRSHRCCRRQTRQEAKQLCRAHLCLSVQTGSALAQARGPMCVCTEVACCEVCQVLCASVQMRVELRVPLRAIREPKLHRFTRHVAAHSASLLRQNHSPCAGARSRSKSRRCAPAPNTSPCGVVNGRSPRPSIEKAPKANGLASSADCIRSYVLRRSGRAETSPGMQHTAPMATAAVRGGQIVDVLVVGALWDFESRVGHGSSFTAGNGSPCQVARWMRAARSSLRVIGPRSHDMA